MGEPSRTGRRGKFPGENTKEREPAKFPVEHLCFCCQQLSPPCKRKKPRAPFPLIQKLPVRTAKLCHLGNRGIRKVYPGWALQWPGSPLFLFSSSGQPHSREWDMKLQVSDANLATGQLSLDYG